MATANGDVRIVRLDDGTESRALERLPFDDPLINEGTLQRLIDQNPALVPGNQQLVSLGREIGTAAGPIDNLFIDASGRLTIVEVKLWRNPEARRKVVAQALDYASAVASWSYTDFERAIQASSNDDRSIWERVCAADAAMPPTMDEGTFVDAAVENLERGAFDIVILGDGIRSDIQNLTGLLASRPDLAFHLELVQLRLYRLGDDELVVVPQVIGATHEVTRAIVEVATDGDRVYVNVQAPEEEVDIARSSPARGSLDDVMALAATEEGKSSAEIAAATAFMHRWVERGCKMEVANISGTLYIPTTTTKSGYLPIVRLFYPLDFWLRWEAPTTHGIVTADEMSQALVTYEQRITDGTKFQRRIDWTSDAEVAQLDGFMAWLMRASVGGAEEPT